MKYFLTGAQGTGKTSIMDALPENYTKLRNITRNCINREKLDINMDSNNRSQKAIFDAYERELSSADNYIAERSLFDVYAYTMHQVKLGKCSPTLAETQLSHIEKFVYQNPTAIYFYLPIEFEPKEDGVRSTDKEYQKEIDKILYNALKNFDITVVELHGTVEERVNTIKSIIHN
jgi:predicted ATPase